jgi:hypothetical protein
MINISYHGPELFIAGTLNPSCFLQFLCGLIEDKCSVDLGADHNQLIGHGAKRKMEIY